jgi:twitching motility protein PilT
MDILKLFSETFYSSGTDLHLNPGYPPMCRVNGRIRKIEGPILSSEDIIRMIYPLLNDDQQEMIEKNHEIDFAQEIKDLARFRINVYNLFGGTAVACRIIPITVPSLHDLNLPPQIESLTSHPNGLILVTGPTGHGKTTTIAALLSIIVKTRMDHIITIEDPIEYVFSGAECLVSQRELGTHTHSFSDALRSALREDPDVILLGEMRDLETTALALTAAETGHLVFSTLHTNSAQSTAQRIVDMFPPHQQSQIRMQLADSLRAVICQTLIPTSDETARVPVCEILLGTHPVRNLIREGKTHQIESTIQTSISEGMQTHDQSLQYLVKQGFITPNEAFTRAHNKNLFL